MLSRRLAQSVSLPALAIDERLAKNGSEEVLSFH
jgi:hypothetical protein